MRYLYLTILALFLLPTHALFAQTISGVVNSYWPVTAVTSNTVTIGDVYGAPVTLKCGDRVLIIQMQGGTFNTTTSSSNFGDITSVGSAGNYEYANVLSVAGSTVTLTQNLTKSYSVAGKVQLVYVPVYSNPTVALHSGISAIRVTEGGFGYTTPPAVTFASGAAAGTAVIENGVVTHIILTNPGTYAAAPPNVTIAMPTDAPFNVAPFRARATATRGLTCLQWNGSCGGVLVFESEGVVTLNVVATASHAPNGIIDVLGMGFPGGTVAAHASAGNSLCTGTTTYAANMNSNFNYGGTDGILPTWRGFGAKGHSFADLAVAHMRGIGKWGTGGGGGQNVEAGGGGGGNYGAGGIGGKTSTCEGFGCGTHGCPNSTAHRGFAGLGLGATHYANAVNKVFLGGGGGGGAALNSDYSFATVPGGAGGGIVMIKAPFMNGNNQVINANGHSCRMGGADGTGGGGGGGVILLDIPTFTTAVTANANGGNGGSTTRVSSTIAYGPGGGGGGGVVWTSAGSLPANLTANANQGSCGFATNVSATEQHGSTSGAVGAVLTGLVMPGPATIALPPAPAIAPATNVVCAAFTANWGSAFGVDGYMLDVSTSSTFASFVAGYQNLDVGNVLTYDVTGLTNNTTYYYRVRAYRNCSPSPGLSNYSGSETVATSPITAPTGIAGVAGCDRVVLTWNAAAGADSYVLDGTTVASNYATYLPGWQNTDIGNVTTITITGLTGGTAYRFRIRAVHSACNPAQSANHQLSSITPAAAPAANAIRRWDGDGDGISWSDALNWDCDVVPISTQSVTLDNSFVAGSYNVNLPDDAVTITAMTVAPSAGNNIVVTIPSTNTATTALTLSTNTTGQGLILRTGAKFINAYNQSVGTDRSIVFSGAAGRLRLEGTGHYVHAGRSFDGLIVGRTVAVNPTATFEYDIPNIPVASAGVYNGLRVWPIASTNTINPIVFPNLVFSNTGNGGNPVAYMVTNDGTTGAATTSFATTINGNLTINADAFYGSALTGATPSTRAINFIGNVTNNGANDPRGTSCIGFGTTNPVNFNGSSLQTISGQPLRIFSTMSLNNSAGVTTNTEIGLLNGGTAATQGSLFLGAGVLTTTGTGKVVVYTPTQKITRSAGHVNGIIRQYVQSSTNYIYHLGNADASGTGYRRMDFNVGAALSGLTHVEGQFIDTPSDNTGGTWPVVSGQILTDAGSNGYWSLEPDNGGFSISYELRLYLANMGTFVDNEFTIVSRPTGSIGKSSWEGGGTINSIGGTGRLVAGGYASRYGLTSFSEKAIGTSSNGNPFPVEVVNFNGQLTETNTVALNWTTLSERNADFFEVERSTDGLASYKTIANVKAIGNSNQANQYLTYDSNPVLGTQIYRLKQVDFDGTVSYHGLVEVTLNSWNGSPQPAYLRLFPNPQVSGNNLIVEFRIPAETEADVMMVNTLGQTVWTGKVTVDGSLARTEIPTENLAAGLYTVRIAAHNTEIAGKVFITK